MEQLYKDLSFFLEHAEELNKMALEMTDFNIDNNQVSLLLAAAFRLIKKNSNYDPYDVITSYPSTKEYIVNIVKQLQEGAEE